MPHSTHVRSGYYYEARAFEIPLGSELLGDLSACPPGRARAHRRRSGTARVLSPNHLSTLPRVTKKNLRWTSRTPQITVTVHKRRFLLGFRERCLEDGPRHGASGASGPARTRRYTGIPPYATAFPHFVPQTNVIKFLASITEFTGPLKSALLETFSDSPQIINIWLF